LLGEVFFPASLLDALHQSQFHRNERFLFLAEAQKITGRTYRPTGRFQFHSLRCFHGITSLSSSQFVVPLESALTLVDDVLGSGFGFLGKHRPNDDGIRIEPVNDTPSDIFILDSRLVAPPADA
jgi:hypothetical protein